MLPTKLSFYLSLSLSLPPPHLILWQYILQLIINVWMNVHKTLNQVKHKWHWHLTINLTFKWLSAHTPTNQQKKTKAKGRQRTTIPANVVGGISIQLPLYLLRDILNLFISHKTRYEINETFFSSPLPSLTPASEYKIPNNVPSRGEPQEEVFVIDDILVIYKKP